MVDALRLSPLHFSHPAFFAENKFALCRLLSGPRFAHTGWAEVRISLMQAAYYEIRMSVLALRAQKHS